MKEKLLSRIAERKITVGVVGLGYVGLPLAVEKAKAGFRTIGFDVQEEKVKQVNAGHNYIGDVVDAELAQLVRNGTLSATSDFSFIKDVDFVAICVPTPLDVHQEPDISYVESSAKSIAGHLTAGTIVVLESTTYPGTTEELIKPILESGSGLKCGKDFYLGFSPERVDPGNAVYNKVVSTNSLLGYFLRESNKGLSKQKSKEKERAWEHQIISMRYEKIFIFNIINYYRTNKIKKTHILNFGIYHSIRIRKSNLLSLLLSTILFWFPDLKKKLVECLFCYRKYMSCS